MTEQNGARLAADILKERGPGVVFGYPGAAVLELFDALVRSGLRVVVPAHEQGGIFAADGFARMTGRAGVVAATSGPGATNLVTGLANAFMDSVPLVAVTGNVPSDLIGRDSFQEVYVAGITVPVTKHNFVVRRPGELEEILLSAFDIAESGRPGPVLVDIPRDVSAAPNARKGVSFPARPLPFPTEGELEAAAERINAARRPLVLAGGGVCRSGAGAALEAFLKAGTLPCAHTLMAEGLLGEGPLNLGLCGVYGTPSAGRAMRECDLLIAVGTRFSDRVVPDRSLFEGRAVLHLDVDEAEINKNVRADGLLGEAGALLAALTPRLRPHPAWTAPDPPGEEDFPLAAVRLIQRRFPEAVFTTDVGQHQMWAAKALRGRLNGFLTSGGLGAMGYGLGAAIGAKLARPDLPVVHLTGDGSFHMNCAELSTAAREGLDLLTVVFDNRRLGLVRQLQKTALGGRYACTAVERPTDYVRLAEALGGRGRRARSLPELDAALQEAAGTKGPFVIWLEIDPEADV